MYSDWNQGVLMVSIGAMYLSAYPLTIAIRSSSEKPPAIGFYDSPDGSALSPERDAMKHQRRQAIINQAQRLLLSDFTLIFIGMVLVQMIENESIHSDKNFNSFKVIFEVISAYG